MPSGVSRKEMPGFKEFSRRPAHPGGMDMAARNRNLRVCPTCWSTVHRDELAEHEGWHVRMREEAVLEARRLLLVKA